MILYLHGFLSSPASAKARQLHEALDRAGCGEDFVCPRLPVSPRAAAEVVLATAQLEDPGRLVIVGSSLGGFYATWLAEAFGGHALLLNPAVRPYELLRDRVGWLQDAGGTPVEVRPEYLDELRALETRLTRPERYLLIAATGDELIDYRAMVERYGACPMRILPGSDHALSDFASLLPEVLRFCGVPPAVA